MYCSWKLGPTSNDHKRGQNDLVLYLKIYNFYKGTNFDICFISCSGQTACTSDKYCAKGKFNQICERKNFSTKLNSKFAVFLSFMLTCGGVLVSATAPVSSPASVPASAPAPAICV